MGNLAKKKGKTKMLATGAVAAGGVLSIIFVHWLLGVALLAFSFYMFWGVIKYYASTGQRF